MRQMQQYRSCDKKERAKNSKIEKKITKQAVKVVKRARLKTKTKSELCSQASKEFRIECVKF